MNTATSSPYNITGFSPNHHPTSPLSSGTKQARSTISAIIFIVESFVSFAHLHSHFPLDDKIMFAVALKKNNEAVAMMDRGKYSEALHILSQLLASMKKEIEWSSSELLENQRFSRLDQCMLDQSINARCRQEDDCPFIYAHAIRIPASIASSYKQEISTIPSIVIFNLALAYQLSCATTKGPRDGNLQRALKLYCLAFQLQQGEVMESNTLFALAILSNSGAIQHSLNAPRQSAIYFGHVLSILMVLKDAGGEIDEATYLHGFFHNVHTQLLCKKTSGAAAAA